MVTPEIYPTPAQNLLLRAAASSPEHALAAYGQWKASVDLQALEYSSLRLLPLLYHHLHSFFPRDPDFQKFGERYLRVRKNNEFRVKASLEIIKSLSSAGIDVMVLKGLALGQFYYDDWGCRPMADVDILVPSAKAKTAIAILESCGWRGIYPPDRLFPQYLHAWTLVNSEGHSCDLHWHLLGDRCYDGTDEVFWDGAETKDFGGCKVKVLNPTDQLFHVCVHGFRSNITRPIYWVADALVVLGKRGPEVSWEEFVKKAQSLDVTPTLFYCLTYLRQEFQADIPPSVLNQLKPSRLSKWQRIEFETFTRQPKHFRDMEFFELLSSQFIAARLFGRRCNIKSPWGSYWHYLVFHNGRRSFLELVSGVIRVFSRRLRRWYEKRSK